jgi:hypothetical protein
MAKEEDTPVEEETSPEDEDTKEDPPKEGKKYDGGAIPK